MSLKNNLDSECRFMFKYNFKNLKLLDRLKDYENFLKFYNIDIYENKLTNLDKLVLTIPATSLYEKHLFQNILIDVLIENNISNVFFEKSHNLFNPNISSKDILYIESSNNQGDNINYFNLLNEFKSQDFKYLESLNYSNGIRSSYIYGFEEQSISNSLIKTFNNQTWMQYIKKGQSGYDLDNLDFILKRDKAELNDLDFEEFLY